MAAAAMVPHFRTIVGLHPEEHRLPQHQVRQLADLDRAHGIGDPMVKAGLMVYLAM